MLPAMRSPRILVVEPHALNRAVLAEQLATLGYACTCVASAGVGDHAKVRTLRHHLFEQRDAVGSARHEQVEYQVVDRRARCASSASLSLTVSTCASGPANAVFSISVRATQMIG